MKIKFLYLFITLFCFFKVNAQQFAEKTDIQAFKSKVYLSCIISSGNICNGIDILRSTDSVIFESIGSIAGTCGSINSPTTYSFIDESPVFNQTLYYKFGFGGYGESEVMTIKVLNLNQLQYQLYPQPALDFFVLEFENKENIESELQLFNSSGQEMYVFKTNLQIFEINTSEFEAGVYVFKLKRNSFSDPIIGKILIQ